MHPAILATGGYFLIITSIVALVVLMRKNVKQLIGSSLHALTMSDIFSSVITGILLILNQYNPPNGGPFADSQTADATNNRTWMKFLNIDDANARLDVESSEFWNINETQENDYTEETISCNLHNVAMHYAMFLFPFANAFVSLLMFSVRANVDLNHISSKCNRIVGSTACDKNGSDDSDDSEIDSSRKRSEMRVIGFGIVGQWLIPMLLAAIVQFAGQETSESLQRSNDMGCVYGMNFPFENCYNVESSESVEYPSVEYTTPKINDYMESIDSSRISDTNSSDRFTDIVSKIYDIVGSLSNSTGSDAEDTKLPSYYEVSQLTNITQFMESINSNDKNLEEANHQLVESMNSNDTDREESIDRLEESMSSNDKDHDELIDQIEESINSNDKDHQDSIDQFEESINSNDKDHQDYIDQFEESMNSNDKNHQESIDQLEESINSNDNDQDETIDQLEESINSNDKNQDETIDQLEESINSDDNDQDETFDQLMESSDEYSDTSMHEDESSIPEEEFDPIEELKLFESLITNSSKIFPEDTTSNTTELLATTEDSASKVQEDNITPVSNDQPKTNDEIYADIVKKIQAVSTQLRVREKLHSARDEGTRSRKNIRVSNYHSIYKKSRDAMPVCMKNQCFVSKIFMKIHLLSLIFLIYFLPILMSTILHTRVKYACLNIKEKLATKARVEDFNKEKKAEGSSEEIIDKSGPSGWFPAIVMQEHEICGSSSEDLVRSSKNQESSYSASGTSKECTRVENQILCSIEEETRETEQISELFKTSLLLAVLLWSPIFLQILAKVFLCANGDYRLMNSSFFAAVLFGAARNILNLRMIRTSEIIHKNTKKDNAVYPSS